MLRGLAAALPAGKTQMYGRGREAAAPRLARNSCFEIYLSGNRLEPTELQMALGELEWIGASKR